MCLPWLTSKAHAYVTCREMHLFVQKYTCKKNKRDVFFLQCLSVLCKASSINKPGPESTFEYRRVTND